MELLKAQKQQNDMITDKWNFQAGLNDKTVTNAKKHLRQLLQNSATTLHPH